MPAWRFTDGDSDGEVWLRYPLHAHIYIDYRSPQTDAWRRVGMATRSWVAQILTSVGVAGSDPLCAIVPTLVIVPDAQRLRRPRRRIGMGALPATEAV
jgi:hypothetical protein